MSVQIGSTVIVYYNNQVSDRNGQIVSESNDKTAWRVEWKLDERFQSVFFRKDNLQDTTNANSWIEVNQSA